MCRDDCVCEITSFFLVLECNSHGRGFFVGFSEGKRKKTKNQQKIITH